MLTRRNALEAMLMACGAAALTETVAGQTPPRGGQREVFRQALPNQSLAGWQLRVLELTYAPGATSPVHRHGGFVVGYVLSGSIRFKITDQPEVVLGAGQFFYEPPGAAHEVSANASATEPATFLAMLFDPPAA